MFFCFFQILCAVKDLHFTESKLHDKSAEFVHQRPMAYLETPISLGSPDRASHW